MKNDNHKYKTNDGGLWLKPSKLSFPFWNKIVMRSLNTSNTEKSK